MKELLAEKEFYGLIVMDRSEATFAILKGRHVEIVETITSGVPGKHDAGGQSARRFERIIEQLAHEFYKRIGEHANRIFLKIPELKGIIVGGPGYSKEEFVEGDYLHYTLKEKIIGVFDVGYSGESGIYELLVRAKDLLKDVRYMKEKEVMNRFLYHLSRDTGLAVYGENEVRKALDMGALDKLLLSEDLEKYRIKFKCIQCGYEGETTVKSLDDVLRCPKCGSEVQVIEEKTLIDEFVEKAKNSGAEVILVSSSTSEGKELLKTFGGIAGLLRFKI